MAQIHFIGGEKGGVGKSVVSRLLAQYFIDKNQKFHVFDADLSHGAMIRYYADYSIPVDISVFENVDKLAESAIENDLMTIVDLPAQSSRPLDLWIEESGLLELSGEVGLDLVFWHVLDDGSDSANLLSKLISRYGSEARFVIVRNYGRGSNFSHIEQLPALNEIDKNNFSQLDIPGLHAPTMRKIDHISASFWAAANNNESVLGPTLGLIERQRVKMWLKKSFAEFDKIFDA